MPRRVSVDESVRELKHFICLRSCISLVMLQFAQLAEFFRGGFLVIRNSGDADALPPFERRASAPHP